MDKEVIIKGRNVIEALLYEIGDKERDILFDLCDEADDLQATLKIRGDEIADLRAALKTCQDYGEELTAKIEKRGKVIAERDATIAEQSRRLEYCEGVIGWMEQEFHPDRPYGEADTKYQNEMSAKREG
jgi:uncharacterized protein (DUF3084 family)